MITDKTCTIPVFIDFLKRLLFKQDKPVFLVVDGHPVHKSKKVKEFAESTNGKLKLFFLPGYSPELNPDETVWSYDYSSYKKSGFYIGSGPVESANKTVLQKRCKGPGMMWDEYNAQYIQPLRSQVESKIWVHYKKSA